MNNHEGLAKRFSMNYMDTVGNGKDKRFYRFLPRNFFNPSDLKRSGKYYLEESNFLKTKLPTPIKRFSMNFLDTLDNPQQKRFSMNYLDSLNNPQQKRFSMNYMDTLKNSKQKKFSMNFLDSLDQQPRRKRFTMNFMDTLGQKGLLSKHRSSLSGHHRREENGKICFSLLPPFIPSEALKSKMFLTYLFELKLRHFGYLSYPNGACEEINSAPKPPIVFCNQKN